MAGGQSSGSQTQGNEGIMRLLAAEKKAAEKVTEARKRKVKRIKQASEEALLEIEAYRAQRERSYMAFEEQHAGNKEDVTVQIEKENNEYIRALDDMVKKNRKKVIEELLELVFQITPKVHPNFFVLKAFNQM